MTADGLARLLVRLDADAERAGEEYERLRRTLVRFFDWRGVSPPDECADEAIDRLALRLQDGVAVDDVRRYAHGIARMILLERRRAPACDPLDLESTTGLPAPAPEDDARAHDCLDSCLAALPAESRSFVLDYYRGERGARIANRRRLAGELGLSDSALRNRVQRLRDRLEGCVRRCVAVGSGDL